MSGSSEVSSASLADMENPDFKKKFEQEVSKLSNSAELSINN